MRARAIVHVAGPKGAGKTTLVEHLLRGFDGFALAARCIRNDKLKESTETAPKNSSELRRYTMAGACGTAVFAFPEREIGSDAFFCTDLMSDYSQAVVLEGDSPVAFADVEAFVAAPLRPGESLLVRRKRDRAQEELKKANALERLLLQNPEAIADLFDQMIGGALAHAIKKNPRLLEKSRTDMLEGLARFRNGPQPKATEHWAVADGYQGIERAQVIVVNVRENGDRQDAKRLLVDLDRIRKDAKVSADVLGPRGKKTPVTAVIADLSDMKDAGTKKVVGRIRRKMQQHQ